MIVLKFNMTSMPRVGGGEVMLQGVVRDPQIVSRMEKAVRDKYHELSSKRVQERVREKTYSWHFETSISVGRRNKTQFTAHLPRSAESKEKDAAASDTAKPAAAEKRAATGETPPAATEKPRAATAETPPAATEKPKPATGETPPAAAQPVKTRE